MYTDLHESWYWFIILAIQWYFSTVLTKKLPSHGQIIETLNIRQMIKTCHFSQERVLWGLGGWTWSHRLFPECLSGRTAHRNQDPFRTRRELWNKHWKTKKSKIFFDLAKKTTQGIRNLGWRFCLVLVWSVEVWADTTHSCLCSSLSISCFTGSQLHSSFHEKTKTVLLAGQETVLHSEAKQNPKKVSSFKLIWAKPQVSDQVKRLNSNSDLCVCEEDRELEVKWDLVSWSWSNLWLLESLWVSEDTGWGPELRRNKPNYRWKVWWLHTDFSPEFTLTLQCLQLWTDNLSIQISVFSSKTQQKGLIVLRNTAPYPL